MGFSAHSSTVEVDLDRLQYDLGRCLAEVFGVAKTAATTTGVAWRALVEAMTGQPPRVLPPAGDGANPAEVRSVLQAIQVLYLQRLAVIEREVKREEVAEDVADAVWTFRHRRLDTFVADETATYISTMVPKPSVASVFAKAAARAGVAAATAATTTAAPVASTDLRRCTTCAAPRLGDGRETHCLYCGDPFVT